MATDSNNTTNNFLPPIMECNSRPLSTYDNLNSNTSTLLQSSTISLSNGSMNGNYQHTIQTPPASTEKEFPFSDISFKFDDLPSKNELNQTTNNNNNSNHANHNGTTTIAANNSFTSNHNNSNSSSIKSINNNNAEGQLSITNNSHHHRIDDSSNNKININSPVVNNNNNNKYVTSIIKTTTTNQYENVCDTVKLRNLQKSAISDAKSSFFGITTGTTTTMPNNTNKYQPFTNVGSSTSINTDRIPLIAGTSNNSAQIQQQHQHQPQHHSAAAYQNIPLNSACFAANVTNNNNSNNCDLNNICENEKYSSLSNTNSTKSVSPSFNNDTMDNYSGGMHHTLSSSPSTSIGAEKYFAEATERMSHSPSQAVYMSTTVPQNIKGLNIAGRHKPTRNSLRHSRMIVVNKNYQGTDRPNPLDITHPGLAKLLLILQIILGICITCLALWILLWAPSTRTRDNPYWSGLMLVLSGILGLILIEFRRIPRHKIREHCFTFLRLNSITLTSIAVFFAFSAFIFAAIHLGNIASPFTTCISANIFTTNAACICLFGGSNTTEHLEIQTAEEGEISAGGFEFSYRDLSCSEVTGPWKYILLASTVLNAIGFCIALSYLVLMCFKRKTKRKYSSVRTQL